jgi:hypothetical protein
LPPGPAANAIVVTVAAQTQTAISVRDGEVDKPIQLPGPVTVDAGSTLELHLQEVKGTRPWTTPVSSNPSVLRQLAAAEESGYLVAHFRAEKQGAAAIHSVYPCGPGMCAALGFTLDIVVSSPQMGTMLFSGAVTGTSSPEQLTCIRDGSDYRYFSVLMEGTLNGKRYFFRLNAYPYSGPGVYSSVYHQPEPLSSGPSSTPDPLLGDPPTGYPSMGFLNFLPKSDSSYSAENKTGTSVLVIYAGEQKGFLDAQLGQPGGPPLHMVGAFMCGKPFNP